MYIYSKEFFESKHADSLSSAIDVIPIIMEIIQPRSVLDVGCGTGTWLKVFRKKHMPQSKLVICLLERSVPVHLLEDEDFDEVVLAKDMGFANFESMIFKYTQYEAACACKGQLMKYVYNKYNKEQFFSYIDSDTQVFSRFDEVFSALKTHSIVFTPHYNEPPRDTHTIWGENAEILILRVGIINGGFIGMKRSVQSEKFFGLVDGKA